MATSSKVRRQMLRGTYRSPALEVTKLSGNEIRAAAVQTQPGPSERVVRILAQRGPCITREISNAYGAKKQGELREILARLVDEGKIIATKRSPAGRGRPAVVWQMA